MPQSTAHNHENAPNATKPYDLLPEDQEHLRQMQGGTDEERKIAELYRTHQLPDAGLKEILKAFRDPNKARRSDMKQLKKAMASGVFSRDSKLPKRIFEISEKSEKNPEAYKETHEYATDILQNTTRKITRSGENEHLRNLSGLENKAQSKIVAEQEKTALPINKQRNNLVERAMRTHHPKEKPLWQPENPLSTEDRLELRKNTLRTTKNYQELVQIRDALRAPNLSSQKREELLAREQKLIRNTISLESKNSLSEGTYLQKAVKRKMAIRRLAHELGLKAQNLSKITVWDISGISPKNLQGIHALSVDLTGKTRKKTGTINLLEITFDEDIAEYDGDGTGAMCITFRDSNGTLQEKVNYTNFVHYLRAVEGYTEIGSPSTCEKELSRQLGFKTLEECVKDHDTFSFMRAVSVDDTTGKTRYQVETFGITDLYQEDGEWYLRLDTPVTTMPRTKLGISTPAPLYHDRKAQRLKLGEFARFVRENKVSRTLQVDEIDEWQAKYWESVEQEVMEMFPEASGEEQEQLKIIIGIAPGARPSLPKVGEVREYVIEGKKQRCIGKLGPNGKYLVETLADDHSPGEVKNAVNFMADFGNGRNQNAPPPPQPSAGGKMLTQEEVPMGVGTEFGPFAEQQVEGEAGKEVAAERAKQQGRIDPEALPMDQVFKYDNMDYAERSYMVQLWKDTQFLSVGDIWQLCKAGYEYYIRRHERRQKHRYSTVAKNVPFFAPEMQRINQAAENEQVNQFKEAMEQMGIDQIHTILCSTSNRDEMKAAFVVLSQKGQIRWDDIDVWKNINQFVAKDKFIPIPRNGDPRTQLSKDDQRTGYDFLRGAIDSLWGIGQYNDWYSATKSGFDSGMRKFFEEGKELEGVTGGHGRRLEAMLRQHKRGEWVDPQEFEGLLHHAIDNGKASMQEKLYYMIEGVGAVNMHGKTIMDVDRLAHINSNLLPKFPMLEYITAQMKRPPEGKLYRLTKDDYIHWAQIFDDGRAGDPSRAKPGKEVDTFLWKYIIPSDYTQNRINKAIRNAENMDHDDMFAYFPPLTTNIVTDVTQGMSGAGKKFLTVEGYANAFPGYSQYIRSLAESGSKNKLKEGIKSYMRFESIIRNRYAKEQGDRYQRFDNALLQSPPIVSDIPPIVFINELNFMIQNIAEAYAADNPKLMETVRWAQHQTGSLKIEGEKKTQDKVQLALEQFDDIFDKAMKSDNGDRMLQVVRRTHLTGMPLGLSTKEELAERKLKQPAMPEGESIWLQENGGETRQAA